MEGSDLSNIMVMDGIEHQSKGSKYKYKEEETISYNHDNKS